MTTPLTGTVNVGGVTYNVTGVPANPPPPPPVSGLNPIPKVVAGCYWTNWNALTLGQVNSAYNLIWLFQATCASNGTASFSSGTQAAASFKTDLQAKRAKGVCCILTVGGSNVNVPLTVRANSTNFVASIKSIYTALGGIDGLDFDIENNADINATELVWIAQQLKAAYPGFNITWAGASPNWITNGPAAVKAMNAAGVFDMTGVMCYDWSQPSEDAKISVTQQYITTWVGYVGAGKVCIGIELPNNDDDASNTFGSYSSAVKVWQWAKATYPGIRGMDIWDAYEDVRASGGSGGTFVSQVIPAVLA